MLIEKLAEDLKVAMKARDESRVLTLRQVSAALKNKRIELQRDLTEDDALAVVRSLVKQYRDAVEDFRRGGREELVSKTEAEIKLLESYLPAAPSDDEVRRVVKEKIAELGATSAKDFGKVMGATMKVVSAASGEQVSKIVKEMLS